MGRDSGDFAAAVWTRGGHLVAGDHGDRDGGRGAPLLQRAAAAGHEEDPRHAAAQAEEPEGVPAAAGVPVQDAGAGPRPAHLRRGAAAPPLPAAGGAAELAGAADATAPPLPYLIHPGPGQVPADCRVHTQQQRPGARAGGGQGQCQNQPQRHQPEP